MKIFETIRCIIAGRNTTVRISKQDIDEMQKAIEKMAWLLEQYKTCLEEAEKRGDQQNTQMYSWAIKSTERRISELERKVSAC